jgi:hypothetical protein
LIYLFFRLLVNKNKLYISPKTEPLPLPLLEQQNHDMIPLITPVGSTSVNPINVDDSRSTSTFTSSVLSTTTFLNSSSLVNTPIRNNNSTSASGSSTSTSNSTVRSDQSFTNTTESPFLQHNINDFIQHMVVQLQLDHKVSGMKVLTINNTINVVDEMLELFEIMNNADLLKNPMISVITERYVAKIFVIK